MELEAFVKYALTADGVAVLVGWILFQLGEVWPAYANEDPVRKRVLFFVICLLVPLGLGLAPAVLILHWPLTWELAFMALQAGFVAFSAGTLAHAQKLFSSPTRKLGAEVLALYHSHVSPAASVLPPKRDAARLFGQEALKDGLLALVAQAARRQ